MLVVWHTDSERACGDPWTLGQWGLEGMGRCGLERQVGQTGNEN